MKLIGYKTSSGTKVKDDEEMLNMMSPDLDPLTLGKNVEYHRKVYLLP